MHTVNVAFSFHPTLMSAITIDIDRAVFIQLGLFLLLFFAIKPLLLDPFLRMIEEREKRGEGARKQAREMDLEAGRLGKQYDEQLEKVRRIAAEEREKLRAEAQKLEADIFAKAQREAHQIVTEGKQSLEKQAEQIRQELSQQSAVLSKQIVSKVLGREVS